MGKRVKIPEAATLTGLTEYTIRKGISEGRYPHIRTSGGKGKILIDITLLEQALEREALNNVLSERSVAEVIHYGELRKVKA